MINVHFRWRSARRLQVEPDRSRALPGEPGVFVSIRQVVDGMRRHPVDPLAVSALGLVLLMATPGLAVAVAIPAFVAARDFRYAGIASLVLAMLLVSLLLSGAIH